MTTFSVHRQREYARERYKNSPAGADAETKIAIVGAGIAGLSAAHYLKKKGYTNVTLFEAEREVGGKCKSIEHAGKTYDLGAIVLAEAYERIFALAHEYGARITSSPNHILPTSAENGATSLSELSSFKTWKAFAKFLYLLIKNRAIRKPGFFPLPSEDLSLPISEYFKKHGLTPIEHLLVVPFFTACGYGFPEKIPVAYLFKFLFTSISLRSMHPKNWLGFSKTNPGDLNFLRFADGFQGFCKNIAVNFHVRCTSPVQKIERTGQGVFITVNDQQEKFDAVFLTVDPEQILSILDATSEEKILLQKAQYVTYHSILCEVENAPEHFYINNLNHSYLNRLLVLQKQCEGNIFGAYVLSDSEISHGQIIENITADIARLGGKVIRILHHKMWQYFPHVLSNDMNSFYSGMQKIQGKQNTFYLGEIMNFANIEAIAEYSESVVNQYFSKENRVLSYKMVTSKSYRSIEDD